MIYLDNASTTKPKFFAKDYSDDFLNINANYNIKGKTDVLKLENEVRECLSVKDGYVIFTRCATESAEIIAKAFNYVNGAQYEHDSVKRLYKNLNPYATQMYYQQYVNQITGVKNMLDEYIFINGGHKAIDLTATIGHAELPDLSYASAVFCSGHKFHAEKGIGILWVNDGLGSRLNAVLSPKNQHNILHGTLNFAGAVAITRALQYATSDISRKEKFYKDLYLALCSELKKRNIEFNIIGDDKERAYAINAVEIKGVPAEGLQYYLANREIYVGTGASACAENEDYSVLRAYGATAEQARNTIRVSFCEDNTPDEIAELAQNIKEFKDRFGL